MTETPTMFRTRVVRTERLTPHMVRVVVGGSELQLFPDNGFTDAYVKLLFPRPGVDLPEDVNPRSLPPEQRPVFRTYTIRSIDPVAHELTIDFVVHGDEGVAGPWAVSAVPGDELLMTSPGGAYSPVPEVDLHLLVGDEAALPAISSAMERLPVNAEAIVLLEVEDASEELPLAPAAGVDLRWLHRASGGGAEALVDAVRALGPLPDRVQVFAHGELMMIRTLKRHLLTDRGLDPELVSASGYWRRGTTEEGFQAEKRDLAVADAAEGA